MKLTLVLSLSLSLAKIQDGRNTETDCVRYSVEAYVDVPGKPALSTVHAITVVTPIKQG